MNNKRILLVSALVLALGRLSGATAGGPTPTPGTGTAVFEISNLTFDHAMLFNLVNAATQGNVASFTGAGPNAGIVSVTIHNSGTGSGTCYLLPTVIDDSNSAYNCDTNGNLATGPVVQTTKVFKPGETASVNLGGFTLVSSTNYSFCQNLKNLVGNNFGGNNSNNNNNSNNSGSPSTSNVLSAVGSVVHELLQLPLTVCLSVVSPSTPGNGGAKTCVPITVFVRPPSVTTASAMLIYPNNTTIATALPSFVWTPALVNGSSLGLVYELVLSQSANGNPWYSVQVPPGETFYQYQSTDRVLILKQQYWWHIIALQSGSMQPVGGQNGQGWSQPQGTFTYTLTGAPNGFGAGVTLQALSQLIQLHASSAVLQALSGMQLQSVAPFGVLQDPDLGALLAKPSEIKSISVEKF